MSKQGRLVKRVIGLSLIAVAGITVFYEYRYSKLQGDSKVNVLVATREINKTEVINETNTEIQLRDVDSITKDTVQDLSEYVGSIATDNIYENEPINKNRIVSEEEYKKKDYKLVSIKRKSEADNFIGNTLKPFDRVDLLYFDKNGVYEGSIYLENQVIYDLVTSEGISYSNRDSGFVPSYALIWVPNDVAEDINAKQETGGYFKFQLYRNKESVEKEN